MKKFRPSGTAAALCLTAFTLLQSCITKQETVIIENVIEVPSYPDLEDIKESTIEFKNAEASFYGAYSQAVDRWYVTLSTEDGVSYDLGRDEYSGKGKVLKLCLQTPISNGKASDMKVMARKYKCPTSSSDLTIGEFETGYDSSYQHPYYGVLYATYGTYFLDLDAEGEYLPLWAIDGAFELKNEGSKWIIEGIIIDGSYTKRRFHFEGEMALGPEYEFPGAPDSVLKEDVSLDATILPKLEIRDRGDQYRYENPPRFSNYRVYLAGPNVTVSEIASKYDVVRLSGEGPVVLLDLFVKPDAGGRIPEGDYELVPRLPNSGIDGSLIWPFKFLEGYPHFYFGASLQGCWYFTIGSDDLWEGDYGRITGGTLNISYVEGSTIPTIKASFNDSLTPAHKININWK